jgi:hypothetical protein
VSLASVGRDIALYMQGPRFKPKTSHFKKKNEQFVLYDCKCMFGYGFGNHILWNSFGLIGPAMTAFNVINIHE